MAWAGSFIAACQDKGLKAVAITDHHDACMVEYVHRHLLASGESNIKVFAGVEITCNDAVQAIALFDSSSNPRDWEKLLSKLGNVTPSAPADAKTCPTEICGFSIKELFKTVSDDKRLKEVCLLIPHFGNPSAHKSLNAAGHHARFEELDCDGFYFESHHSELEEGTLQKAKGEVREWGLRRRALIATGDNKRATWERLGARDCWIKIGEFSTEALRQAFLADEARISHVAPSIPGERIVELRVLSKLTGIEPLTLTFNAGYTAFIGGRGSGKSALLEYLRFGLGRADGDFPAPSASEIGGREREAKLLSQTLDGGYVEVVVEREGATETWRRTGADSAMIEVTTVGRAAERITPDLAQRRFQARAFHQKELSTTMTDSKANVADHITGIVAAEELDRRRKVDREVQNSKRSLTTALQKVASGWQAEYEYGQATLVVEDLSFRIAALNKRLKEEGVDAASMEALEKAPLYGRARNFFMAGANKAKEDLLVLHKLKDSILRLETGALQDAGAFPEVAEADAALAFVKQTVAGHLQAIGGAIQSLSDTFVACGGKFEISSAPFVESLKQATVAQQAHRVLLEELKKLTDQRTEAEAAQSKAAEKFMDTKAYQAEFDAAISEFDGLLEKRRQILRDAAALVENRSANLTAKMKPDRKPDEYVRTLAAMLEGSTVREALGRCELWVSAVAKDGGPGWSKVRDDIMAIYKNKISTGKPQAPGKEISQQIIDFCAGERAITDQAAAKIYAKLSDQIVGEIISAVPRDYIQLTYIDERGDKVSFDLASPGQQASALLELLLNQAAGTLVIDQPEDDLDNRVIMRIVDLIKTSKNIRQLIFATHNPNLVVNGDADKVIAMASLVSDGRPFENAARVVIDVDGAIETPPVRAAITTVMEGGQKAFDLRRKKYRFEGEGR